MNKKILVFGFLAVLMLVTISFASAVTTNTQTTHKESPLFNIRINRAKRINLAKTFIADFLHRDRIFLVSTLLQILPLSGDFRKPHEITMWKGSGNLCLYETGHHKCEI